MKQSERMRKYREYFEHPLREEYERKFYELKGELTKIGRIQKNYLFPICPLIFCSVWCWIAEYGLFGYIQENLSREIDGFIFVTSIVVGFINLGLGIVNLYFISSNDGFKRNESPKKEDLKNEYFEKGLVVIDDPYRESCGEYNRYDVFVCSATQEPLSSAEERWCQVKGNCAKCARFRSAMGFEPDPNDDWWKNKIEKW